MWCEVSIQRISYQHFQMFYISNGSLLARCHWILCKYSHLNISNCQRTPAIRLHQSWTDRECRTCHCIANCRLIAERDSGLGEGEGRRWHDDSFLIFRKQKIKIECDFPTQTRDLVRQRWCKSGSVGRSQNTCRDVLWTFLLQTVTWVLEYDHLTVALSEDILTSFGDMDVNRRRNYGL